MRGRIARPGAVLLALMGAVCLLDRNWSFWHSPERAVTLRLIAATAATTFQESWWHDREALADFQFRSLPELAKWNLEKKGGAVALADAAPRFATGGMAVPHSWSGQWLEYPLEVDAGQADFLEIDLETPVVTYVTACWARAGEWFTEDRCVTRRAGAQSQKPLRFDLRDQAQWTGEIRWMGFSLVFEEPGEALLRRLAIWRLVRSPRAARDPATEPEAWGVDLGGERHPAWLARPDDVIRRDVEVPSGARLRFWVAPTQAVRSPLRAVLSVKAAGREKLLFERELPPTAPGGSNPWQRVEIPLDDFGGRRVRLEFETRSSGPTPAGFVAWGAPMIAEASPERRPNVILISLDTLRADRLSLYGYRRRTSPHLDSWARDRAVVFEQAVAPAPWTLPSHVSLFSGLYPFRHGVNRQGPIPDAIPLLAEGFRAAGYLTHASVVGPLLDHSHGFARGFDSFVVRASMESKADEKQELAAGISEVVRWLDDHREERFFLFFHTYETHTPHRPRAPFFLDFAPRSAPNGGAVIGASPDIRPLPGYSPSFKYVVLPPPGSTTAGRTIEPADQALLDALYDSGVAFLDLELARLLEYLRHSGLERNTVVAIVSDHGESLLEHGLAAHSHLYEDTLHVPLLIAAPGVAPRRVRTQVSGVDVAPTLLELADLPPLPRTDGVSLTEVMRGEGRDRDAWAYSSQTNRGIALRKSARWKFILNDAIWPPVLGSAEAYRLDHDPDELRNVAAEHASEANAFLGEARSLLDRALPAVRLRFANAGREELTARVTSSGGGVSEDAITSNDLDFPCCRYAEATESLEVRVPAGKAFTILMQDRPGGVIEIGVGIGAPTFKQRVDLAKLQGRPRTVELVGGRWLVARGGGSPATGWAAWRTGPSGGAQEPSTEDLRDHLRALGYIR